MLDLWKLYWVVTGRDVSSPITPGLDRHVTKEDTPLVGGDRDEERDDKNIWCWLLKPAVLIILSFSGVLVLLWILGVVSPY